MSVSGIINAKTLTGNNNVVLSSGNQSISGSKTFTDNVTISSGKSLLVNTIKDSSGNNSKTVAQIPQLNAGQTWSGGINYFTSQTNVTHPYLVLGSVSTNASKTGNVALNHYGGSSSVTSLRSTSNSTTNSLNIGGSDSGAYAMQTVNIYSASNNTTTTGTLIATIDTNGITLNSGSITTTGNNNLSLSPAGTGVVSVSSNGMTFANSTSGYVSGSVLKYYENNQVVGIDFTGAFTASNQLFAFTRLGNIVICRMPTIQGAVGTASTLSAAAASIPARYRPVAQYRGFANGLDNGNRQTAPIAIDFKTDGSIVINKNADVITFTPTGNGGPYGTVFVWDV